MRMVRMDQRREQRLERAVGRVGQSLSEFIRQATETRVDMVLCSDPTIEFADVIGVVDGSDVHGGHGQARTTGETFAAIAQDRSVKSRAKRRGGSSAHTAPTVTQTPSA